MTDSFESADVPPLPSANPQIQVAAGQLSAPIAPAERIDALDIVRGIALFGVFVVNMLSFAGPYGDYEQLAVSKGLFGSSPLSWLHQLAEFLIWVLGEGAFYTQFSLLFGLGLAMQMTRATARNERFGRRGVSRLTVLLVFGFLHYTFLWDGDILMNYAVSGMLFLAFSRLEPRAGLGLGVGLLAVCGAVFAALMILVAMFDPLAAATSEDLSEAVEEHQSLNCVGRATDVLNAGDFALTLFIPVLWFTGLFLVGSWLVRTGKVDDWRNQRKLFVNVLKVSVPLVIATRGAMALIMLTGSDSLSQTIRWPLSMILGGPALGATYFCLALLALQNEGPASKVLSQFAPVGRMALTNYLLQSVVGVILFRSYGFGLYGKLGAATTFGITLVVFAAQMMISRLWLARYRFGPMEWLWRKLTYFQLK